MAGCPELAEEALEEPVEENAVLGTHLDELDAHASAGGDVADDAVGADAAAGDFKHKAESGAYDGGIRRGEESAAHTERLRTRDLLIAATIPRHEHALRQEDALVTAHGHTRKCVGVAGVHRGKDRGGVRREPIEQKSLCRGTGGPWGDEEVGGVRVTP